jgi:hypothetical protein
MLGLFSSLTSHIPAGKKLTEPHTEGLVNRLHYRVSFVFLLVTISSISGRKVFG